VASDSVTSPSFGRARPSIHPLATTPILIRGFHWVNNIINNRKNNNGAGGRRGEEGRKEVI